MESRWFVSVWMALLLAATPVAGQPVEGDRVRIGLIDGGGVTGGLVDVTPAALVVDEGGIPVAVPRDRIGELELSLGVRGDFARNFFVSVGVSALLLGGIAVASTDPNASCDMFCGPQAAFVLGAIGGGIVGVPIGLIAGLASRRERWVRVPMPPASDVTLGFGPSAGGGVGLSVRVTSP